MITSNAKAMRGLTAYHAGLCAEDIVAQDYARRGRTVAHRRWRGQAGEIDLIAREGDCVVFIEVKKSKSFETAALRLGRRQMDRLCVAACEFLAGEPRGQLTNMRFDLALIDGRGAMQIIENAFGEA